MRTGFTTAEAEALERGGFVGEPDLDGPLARTAAEYTSLLDSSLSIQEAAQLLGLAPSLVEQRLATKPPSLYGIRLESGWMIPKFQLDDDKLIPGIGEVVAELDPELHPVSVCHWFSP